MGEEEEARPGNLSRQRFADASRGREGGKLQALGSGEKVGCV